MEYAAPLREDFKPDWKKEGFETYGQYQYYYCQLVNDLRDEAHRAWRDIKRKWMDVERRLETEGELTQNTTVSRSDMSLVPQAIEEAVALIVENLPRPKAESRGSHDEQFVGALNQAMDAELDANQFDTAVMPRVAYDMKRFGIGVVGVAWDHDQPPLFGDRPGRSQIYRVDPRYVHIDPFATGFMLKDMAYCIVEKPMDLSEVQAQYPDKKITEESDFRISRPDKTFPGLDDSSFDMTNQEHSLGERKRVVVKELWLNSKVKEKRQKKNEIGEVLYDSATGEPIYEWVKKYPSGRLIKIANKTILFDGPNPFTGHGQLPYVFFPAKLSGRLLTVGDAEPLLKLEAKINRLHKDAIRNLRVNMNSPWIIDRHAFDSPRKFNLLTNDPGVILPVATGARVQRLDSQELPQTLFAFVEYLRGVFDDVLGVQGVMRGQLEKGAQLSADAVSQLQASSTARIKFKNRLMEHSLRHLGHLLQWNVRQFYDTGLTIDVPIPGTDKTQKIAWSDDAAATAYHVKIEAGSGLPGAKEAGAKLMRDLYKEDLISRDYAIRGMKLPGSEKLIKEMTEREERLLQLGMDHHLKRKSAGRPKSK